MNREELIAAGFDYDTGLHRFANKEQMYEKFLRKMFDDPNFAQMQQQIAAKDYENAFKSAHTLKGLSGNLSADAFHDAVCDVVEELRNGEPGEALDAKLQAAVDAYERAKKAVLG